MAENCEKISWVFSFIFSDFVFHIMFNCFPALFRGQIFVLILKLEVFISFVSCIYFRKLFLIFCCFFQSMVMYGTSLSRTGEGRETERRLGREQLGFIFLAASPLVRARVFAASPLSGAPDKTAMLCRLTRFLLIGVC